MTVSGGCQCGAVRYRVHGPLTGSSLCFCRMCQKAFGGYFAPLTGAKRHDVEWTRGRPAVFASSEAVERGFCRECGTPLTYDYLEGDRLCLSIGSLDEPARATLECVYEAGQKPANFARFDRLPARSGLDGVAAEALPLFASRQHPDHDT